MYSLGPSETDILNHQTFFLKEFADAFFNIFKTVIRVQVTHKQAEG